MNRYEEEIVTAQYADDPNDLLPPNGSNPNSGGMSVGCILAIIAASMFCLVIAVVVVSVAYVTWDSKRQNRQAANEFNGLAGEAMVTKSLTADSLAAAVEVFDGADREQNAVQTDADFKGIEKLFQKVADASDWSDTEAVYPYFDFKKHAEVVRNSPETRSFFRQYGRREVENAVRDFGVYIPPFSAWEIAAIETLSPNERLVYVQVQLVYDTTVKRCRVWVTKNRFAGWKVYDWEEVSDLCRASIEAANLIAEPNASFSKAFNRYYDYIETDLQEDVSQAQRASILRKCEGLKLNPKIQPGVLLNVGSYWESYGEPEQALRCLDKIKNKDQIPEVYRLEGTAYEAMEDYEAAIEKYQLFIQRVGVHSDVLQSLVDCYEELGNHDQQQAYQLERFQAWPASSCYFDAVETLTFFENDPDRLFKAIDRSPESIELYKSLLEQLGGNPFALPKMQLVKKYFDESGSNETSLGQRVTALLALADGDRDKFNQLMIDRFKQDPETDVDEMWELAVDYEFHRELFDALEDKEAAFKQVVEIYLYGDWYGSEESFDSICDSYFASHPADKFAIYFQAYRLFLAGKFDSALPMFESIEGRMDGEFKYLNDNITEWRLTILLNQKKHSEALKLAKKEDAVQKLLVVAVEQDAPEMFGKIEVTDLEDASGYVLRGLRSLEKKQLNLATGYFAKFLKLDEIDYRLERLAIEGLIKSQSKASPTAILKKAPTWRMYSFLAGVLAKNQDWKTLESLAVDASKLLKAEFEESDYAKRRVLENHFEALWNQQKYALILKKYKSLGKDVDLNSRHLVFWAAYKQNDLRLARKVCQLEDDDYGDASDSALLAAFEGDLKAFKTEASKLESYSKANLGEKLMRLQIGGRFRRVLYQQAGPVDIDYSNYNVESIEAVFPADWSIDVKQLNVGLSAMKVLTGKRFVLTPLADTGQGGKWAAKSECCGVLIELKPGNNSSDSGWASSPLVRRIQPLLASDHQHFAVSVFPIVNEKRAQGKSPVNYSALASAFFIAINDDSSLAVNSGNGWSDQEEAIARLASIAKEKAHKSLVSIKTVYSFVGEDDGVLYSPEKLGFQKELAEACQRFQNSTETEKSFSATIQYEDAFVEDIEVKLDEGFELNSYGSGATFTATVTKQSTPFGIYQVGDRLEFADSQIERWKLKIGDDEKVGQRVEK